MRHHGRTFLCGSFLAAALAAASSADAQTALIPRSVEAPLPREATVAPAPNPAFSSLFKDTLSDFRRLPSRETATWLGVGAAATLFGHQQDTAISRTVTQSSVGSAAYKPGNALGGAALNLGGALATFAIGRATNSPRAVSVGADLFSAQVMAQAMAFGIKVAAQRTRPDGTSLSFPSGHTASAFASATVLQRHFGWKVGIPAYALASYVGAARIETRRHYLSDVAFGAVLGITAGRTATIGRGAARFAVGPMVTDGGGGVGFTLVGNHH